MVLLSPNSRDDNVSISTRIPECDVNHGKRAMRASAFVRRRSLLSGAGMLGDDNGWEHHHDNEGGNDHATVQLNAQDFEKTITDNNLVFVDFWATWCGRAARSAPRSSRE